MIGRLLCCLGFHKWAIVDIDYGAFYCRRCGR